MRQSRPAMLPGLHETKPPRPQKRSTTSIHQPRRCARATHTMCAPRRAICRATQAAGGSDGRLGRAAVDAMDRSEGAIAEDADGVRCNACGSVLCVDEPKQAAVPPKRPAASTTRKVSPKMLSYHATRAATRVAMLAAIPGIGTARAVAILRAYPTFRQLMAAKHGQLSGLVVRKSPLGEELAVALHRVLH